MKITPLNKWLPQADRPFVVAGRCSAESEEQMMETAKKLASSGMVHLFRAGIWKPRTRPYTFEGAPRFSLGVWINSRFPIC